MNNSTPNRARVAVIILNWNTRPLLQRFLPLVIARTPQQYAEIVVADNGSTDGSAGMVKADFPGVRILRLDKNYGFAGGYNRALKQIEAPYTVLLNSDVEPGENWLPPMIDWMDSNPDYAACMPKIKALDNRSFFEYAGAAGGFIDRLGYTFCRGRLFNVIEEDVQQYNTSGEVFWASGAALMVQSRLFNQSGGLDEHFFAHMEEIDWCWRMKNQGYKIGYVAQSEVYHLGGGTLSNMSSRKTMLNFRNNLFMLFRNLPEPKFHRRLLTRMILDAVAALKFMFSGEWRHAGAVFSAHMTFYRALRRLREERTLLNKKVENMNETGIYPRSIVYDFFVHDKKKFSQLSF